MFPKWENGNNWSSFLERQFYETISRNNMLVSALRCWVKFIESISNLFCKNSSMTFPLLEKSDSGAPPTTKATQFPPSGLFNIYRILSRLDGISPKAIIRINRVPFVNCGPCRTASGSLTIYWIILTMSISRKNGTRNQTGSVHKYEFIPGNMSR